MPILNTVMSFLSSSLNLPVWLPLLLFLTSLPVFIKLLRWFKKPKPTTAKATKTSVKQAPSARNNTSDNIFTSSIIIAAQKLKTITDDPEKKFTKSIISAVEKLQSIKDPAINKISDSIASTASKLKTRIESRNKTSGPATIPQTSKTQIISRKTQSENEKDKIIKLLFASKGEGRLNQSLADDMKISTALVAGYLNDLMQVKLVESRRNLIGETFYLTHLGETYCAEKGYTT